MRCFFFSLSFCHFFFMLNATFYETTNVSAISNGDDCTYMRWCYSFVFMLSYQKGFCNHKIATMLITTQLFCYPFKQLSFASNQKCAGLPMSKGVIVWIRLCSIFELNGMHAWNDAYRRCVRVRKRDRWWERFIRYALNRTLKSIFCN